VAQINIVLHVTRITNAFVILVMKKLYLMKLLDVPILMNVCQGPTHVLRIVSVLILRDHLIVNVNLDLKVILKYRLVKIIIIEKLTVWHTTCNIPLM